MVAKFYKIRAESFFRQFFFCCGHRAPRIGGLSPVSSSWVGLCWPLQPPLSVWAGWMRPWLMVPLFSVLLQQPRPEEDRDHRGEPLAEDQQWQLLQLQHSQLPAQLPGWVPAWLPGWLQRAQQSQRWAWEHPSAPGTLWEPSCQAARARGLWSHACFLKKFENQRIRHFWCAFVTCWLPCKQSCQQLHFLGGWCKMATAPRCQVTLAEGDGSYALG